MIGPIKHSAYLPSVVPCVTAQQPLSLQSLPPEVREKIEEFLPPLQAVTYYDALTPAHHSNDEEVLYPRWKLIAVLKNVPEQYQRAVMRADEKIQAFVQQKFQGLLNLEDPARIVKKHILFQLLYLVGDKNIWAKLGQRIQQKPDQMKALWSCIKDSREENVTVEVQRSAANAITLLIRAGERFDGKDLSNIKISGADLSYGKFWKAQLSGADLKRVKFRGAWLREANLSGANMEGAQFGELPFIQEIARVNACAFSSDGMRCAVGLANHEINIYATSSWEKIRTLTGHEAEVTSVTYSPNRNQLASVSADGNARLWNAATGEPIEFPQDRTRTLRITNVAYLANGKHFAVTDDREMVEVWNLRKGTCVRSLLSDYASRITSLAYSPNGKQLAVADESGKVNLWNIRFGAHIRTLEFIPLLQGHTLRVTSLAYSPNGKQLASGSDDKKLRLWNTETGKLVYILRGHTSRITSLAYSPNGEYLASSSEDQSVRIWSTRMGASIHVLRGHRSLVTSLAYSPTGKLLASASADQTVRLWNMEIDTLDSPPKNHLFRMTSVYLTDRDQLVSGGHDGVVRIWNVKNGKLVRTLIGSACPIVSVAYSSNVQQIAWGSEDKKVRLWGMETNDVIHTLRGHTKSITSLVYSPNGEQLATSDDKTVRVWNTKTGELLYTFEGHAELITSLVYSPNGYQLASSSDDKTVQVWDTKTGKRLHTFRDHASWLTSVAYSPSGAHLASYGGDGVMRLWKIHSDIAGKRSIFSENPFIISLQAHAGAITSIAYAPDGIHLASGGADKKVRLWQNVGVNSHILSLTAEGHTGPITHLAYSPSGELLASASDDKTVRLWDVALGGCLTVMDNSPGRIISLTWRIADGGTYLVIGFNDHAACLWQIIKEGRGYQAHLSWSLGHDSLDLADTQIQDAQGLRQREVQLFRQRSANAISNKN